MTRMMMLAVKSVLLPSVDQHKGDKMNIEPWRLNRVPTGSSITENDEEN